MHSLAILSLIVDALHVPVTTVLYKEPILVDAWTGMRAARR